MASESALLFRALEAAAPLGMADSLVVVALAVASCGAGGYRVGGS